MPKIVPLLLLPKADSVHLKLGLMTPLLMTLHHFMQHALVKRGTQVWGPTQHGCQDRSIHAKTVLLSASSTGYRQPTKVHSNSSFVRDIEAARKNAPRNATLVHGCQSGVPLMCNVFSRFFLSHSFD